MKFNDFSALFPEHPDFEPELVRLVFANGDPYDYQSTIEVDVDDFPVYEVAPEMLKLLREVAACATRMGNGEFFCKLEGSMVNRIRTMIRLAGGES